MINHYEVRDKNKLDIEIRLLITHRMKKACCFTNFKLSRAHVIHIYKTCEKPLLSYFWKCVTEGTSKKPISSVV
jgi:hypothetical protein